MLDTVKFNIPQYRYHLDREDLATRLTKCEIIITDDGTERMVGSFHNLRFRECKHVIQVEGSLPKFFHGNNYRPLSISELKECVEMLSDELHLPIRTMGLSRIDLSDCVELSIRPRFYFDCLVSHPFLNRTLWGTNGLYFTNKTRHISFYDKNAEQRSKNQPIPQEFDDRHLLKYEYAIKKNVKSKFKFLSCITDLYYQDNYIALINAWEDEFDKILKVEPKITNLKSSIDKMDYFNYCTILGMLQRGNELDVYRDLDDLADLGKYSDDRSGKTKLRRHKKQVSKLFETYLNLNPEMNSLKNELINKVHLQADRNRQSLIL